MVNHCFISKFFELRERGWTERAINSLSITTIIAFSFPFFFFFKIIFIYFYFRNLFLNDFGLKNPRKSRKIRNILEK